jgi:2-keto-4-pentenoate hydratase/2-oxohepta-3-ene-1,7-dioic acid hydratase in catechol pathway
VFSRFVRFDGNLEALRLELLMNGQLAQQGGTPLMLFKPLQLLASIQSFMSLNDGDILMTGTPKGVGPVQRGAIFTGRIYSGDSLLVEQQWTAALSMTQTSMPDRRINTAPVRPWRSLNQAF